MSTEQYCSLKSLDFLTRLVLNYENPRRDRSTNVYESIKTDLFKETDKCFDKSKDYFLEVEVESLNLCIRGVTLDTRLRENLTRSDLRRYLAFKDHNYSLGEFTRRWVAKKIESVLH
jgi:hypothetical protein